VDAQGNRGGALAGLKVVEFAGVGPTPMGTMLLADMGAEVVTIDRTEPIDRTTSPGVVLTRTIRLSAMPSSSTSSRCSATSGLNGRTASVVGAGAARSFAPLRRTSVEAATTTASTPAAAAA
jgi:hypothetical protein